MNIPKIVKILISAIQYMTSLQAFKRTISAKKVSMHKKLVDYSFRVNSDRLLAILYILLVLILQLLVILLAVSEEW